MESLGPCSGVLKYAWGVLTPSDTHLRQLLRGENIQRAGFNSMMRPTSRSVHSFQKKKKKKIVMKHPGRNHRRVRLKDSPSSNFMPDLLSGRSATGLHCRTVLHVRGWRPDSAAFQHWLEIIGKVKIKRTFLFVWALCIAFCSLSG